MLILIKLLKKEKEYINATVVEYETENRHYAHTDKDF